MSTTEWMIWSLDGAVCLKPARWFIAPQPDMITTWKTRAGALKAIDKVRAVTSPRAKAHTVALTGSMIPLPLDVERHTRRVKQRTEAFARAKVLLDALSRATSYRNRMRSVVDLATSRQVEDEAIDAAEYERRHAAVVHALADIKLACRDDIDMREWINEEMYL